MWSLASIAATFILLGSIFDVSRADDEADPRAVIDKAIIAVGGETKLAKFKAQSCIDKGTVYIREGNIGRPYAQKHTVQWPLQSRYDGVVSEYTTVLNGDKGWIKGSNGTEEMSPDLLGLYKDGQYARWVAYRLPLKDKGFTFSPVDESQIDNLDAIGVRVSRKNHPDINLFFDKQSGLLVKNKYITTFTQDDNVVNMNVEELYADYCEVEGVKIPMKIVTKRDGKVWRESSFTDVILLDALDDNVFAKP